MRILKTFSILLLLASSAYGQTHAVNGRLLWRDNAWVEGDFRASKFYGDVASATVSGATTFDNNVLGWMLADLKHNQGGEEISETITRITSNIYGFETTFTEETTICRFYFPVGKTIDPNGTFLCTIWGMSWESYDLIPGFGNIDAGIQFSLSKGAWPAGVTAKGLFQLVDSDAPLVFHEFSEDQVNIPSDTPSESAGLVNF